MTIAECTKPMAQVVKACVCCPQLCIVERHCFRHIHHLHCPCGQHMWLYPGITRGKNLELLPILPSQTCSVLKWKIPLRIFTWLLPNLLCTWIIYLLVWLLPKWLCKGWFTQLRTSHISENSTSTCRSHPLLNRCSPMMSNLFFIWEKSEVRRSLHHLFCPESYPWISGRLAGVRGGTTHQFSRFSQQHAGSTHWESLLLHCSLLPPWAAMLRKQQYWSYVMWDLL